MRNLTCDPAWTVAPAVHVALANSAVHPLRRVQAGFKMGPMSKQDKPYSVTLWGSNPDETDNDDCWTGDDYATREEALAEYQSLYKWPSNGLAEHCVGWQFAMVDGPELHGVMANPDQRKARAHKREAERDAAQWRREQAMEAGMLHGIDAYNDEMGY